MLCRWSGMLNAQSDDTDWESSPWGTSSILKEEFCARFNDLTTSWTRLATVTVEYQRPGSNAFPQPSASLSPSPPSSSPA
ncbi:hypothetical protein K443DRAFT_10734 [Laccaria amethystina LaAM-08-1]|uniref:Uncharacterized protein n=1 Tax=Laccaria amethystina LaAM-08-1 TaxID=1095629 RepID=A0A0C9XJ75_9AGAR|nr:hypothetical protein K443DRAFT_10734 [Laccaria amethystina LaAM-08-1]